MTAEDLKAEKEIVGGSKSTLVYALITYVLLCDQSVYVTISKACVFVHCVLDSLIFV